MVFRWNARRWFGGVALTAALLAGAAGTGVLPAAAEPLPPGTGSAEGQEPAEPTTTPAPFPSIERVESMGNQRLRVFVRSPAMQRTVELQMLVPRDRSTPRPTVYMLDGRNAEPHSNNWIERGRAEQFFADKNVNVVLTVGGPASFYTDWLRPDPVLGTNMWETFLTRELPPLIDARFEGNGRNAVMGVSMGAEAAMMLAVRQPERYDAVAAHSGCFSVGTELGQAQARAVVATYSGEPDNMFGPQDDPEWLAHDVMTHAGALRGKPVYLSVGSGMPGKYEVPSNPDAARAATFGAALEAGSVDCTRRLAARLTEVGVPVTANFRPTGTHAWPYWADELEASWPTLAGGLGIS